MGARLRILIRLGADRNLRNLALADLGFGVTEFASWIAVLVYAFERGGVVESGLVGAAMLLPPALIVPFAPYAGQRLAKHRALAAGYGVMAFAAATGSVALFIEAPAFVVYGAMLVLCMGVSFVPPLAVAVLVSITQTPEDLTAANVADSLIDSCANLIGPLLVALLLPIAGASAVFAVLAAVMTLSCLLAARIDGEFQTTGDSAGPVLAAVWREFRAGLRLVSEDDGTRLMIGLLSGRQVLIGAIDVLFVAIAFSLIGTGDSGAALLNAAFGVGLIVGAAFSLGLVGTERLRTFLVLGAVVTGFALALLPRFPTQTAAFILLGACGVGCLLIEVAGRTLLQRAAPPQLTARAFGVLESASLLALTVGTLGISALVSWLGISQALILTGVSFVLLMFLFSRTLGTLEKRYGPPPREILEVLRSLEIFQPLGTLVTEQLARSAEIVEAEPGTELIRQGDAHGPIYILLEGQVDVSIDAQPVRRQGPGEYFGELSPLESVPRTASVTAASRVRALAIEPSLFVDAVTSHPRSIKSARVAADARYIRAETI